MPFCRRRDDTAARVAGPVQDAALPVIEVEHKEKLSEAAHPAPAWHFNSTVWAPPDLQSHLTGAAGFLCPAQISLYAVYCVLPSARRYQSSNRGCANMCA